MASLIQDKKSGYYYAQFYSKAQSPSRKRVPLRTTRRRVAERALAKLEDEFALGTFDPWSEPEPPEEPQEEPEDLSLLGDAARAYLDSCRHLKASTRRTYEGVLRLFVRHVGDRFAVRRLAPKHVQEWLDATNTGDVTRRKYNHHLGYFCRFLVRRGLLKEDLSKKAKLRRVPERAPKAMTVKEVDQLIRTVYGYLEKHRGDERFEDYTWLALLIEANVHLGLRCSELIHLRWEHIDLNRRVLKVANSEEFTTKSSKERAVPISEAALKALDQLRAFRSGPYVFHVEGHRLKPSTLSHAFLRFRRRAGLPEHINLHSTRHTFGTWLAERGVPVTVIQSLMGHSSVTTTERYMSVRADIAEQWIHLAFEKDRTQRPTSKES